MKKVIVLLSILCSFGITELNAKVQIDTIYYDKAWKGVAGPEFAEYYRVTMIPDNANYSKRYRTYYMDGTLQAEGSFLQIDKYDDENSVFDGTCIIYYKDGKIEREINYKDGKEEGTQKVYSEEGNLEREYEMKEDVLDGTWISYYPNGKVERLYNYKSGKFDGMQKEYSEDGNLSIEAEMKEDVVDGVYISYHPNGKVKELCNYKDGKLDGTQKLYSEDGNLVRETGMKDDILDGTTIEYLNGKISQVIPYKEGQVNGTYITYDENGNIRLKVPYKDGLKVGKEESYNNSGTAVSFYKEIIPVKGNEIGLTVCAKVKSVSKSFIKDKNLPSGSRMFNRGSNRCYYMTVFNFEVANPTDSPISCSFSNIVVEYLKNGKLSGNMALREHFNADVNKAWAEDNIEYLKSTARQVAQNASTQSSRSTSFDSSYGTVSGKESSTVSANGQVNSTSAALGSVAGAIVGAIAGSQTNGSVSGTSGTSKQYSGYSSSSGNTNSVSQDGYIEYQVYQQEIAQREAEINSWKEFIVSSAEENSYSSFVVLAHNTVSKCITAMQSVRSYEKVIISFDFNGQHYSVEFDQSEL